MSNEPTPVGDAEVEALRTPAARWREDGKPDPHGDRFNVERAALIGGNLTDDEVAYQTAMLSRNDLKFEAVLAVARDRIRWLSRALTASEQENARLRTELAAAEEVRDGLRETDAQICRQAAATLERAIAAEAKLATAVKALEWYANPEIYKQHPHGPAFDRRDVSFGAREAIASIRPKPASETEEG